jgi:outer membrane receptor protein involved in Fe transport
MINFSPPLSQLLFCGEFSYMRESIVSCGSLAVFIFFTTLSFAQNNIVSGSIRNAKTKELLPAVSVEIRGTNVGTFSDDRGNFRLTTLRPYPLTLVFSSIGYEQAEITVSSSSSSYVQVDLNPQSSLGLEVVVSASRVPEKILESPVSIERISSANIVNTPATGYYDMLRNIKGVDLVYSSLTFATPSTRGFNGSGNPRLNQLVDGIDNQAPGLNFSVGSIVGVTELDVESMELLPGASSALYGSGGMNGTILVNSKDPFRYQGLSFQVKTGIMHVDKKQRDQPGAYHDWSLRWAQKVSEKFAFKIGAQFIQAKDWIASDRSNYQAGDVSQNEYGNVKPGTRTSDPNYDGVNVYGDETTLNLADPSLPVLSLVSNGIKQQLQSELPAPLYEAAAAYLDSTVGSYNGFPVSRTGYDERDVLDNNTVNVKLSGGLYYNISDAIQASLVAYWGTGNTVYTGSDRYSLKDLKIGQYKLEVKSSNWFIRAYTTQENAGESFNATITTRLFNEEWKSSNDWYPQYAQGFLVSKVTPYIQAMATGTAFVMPGEELSHQAGRELADQGRPESGTTAFNSLFDKVRATPISQGGGLFLDRSDLYVTEGQYNFENIGFADLLVGASFKQYVLNSQGTLFADTAGPIRINEIGAYAQLSRSFLEDKFKLTASGRYDKNENFEGRFTPRFTAVYKVAQDHNLRASYQTAYRFPTTQNQWINLVIGGGTVLIGGLPELRDFYNFSGNKAYTLNSVRSAGFALATGTPPEQALALLQERQFGEYKPEVLNSFELGYKGLVQKRILIDAYGYLGGYENFLGRTVVLQSLLPGNPAGLFSGNTRRAISVAINSDNTVTTYGFGISVDYLMQRNFVVSGNFSSDRIKNNDPAFIAFFNVPSYRLILSVANTGFGYQNRFGFSVNMRNQDGYYFESDFRQGEIPGYTTVDAQVSYKFPSSRSILKIGGTNVTNKYYRTGFGNPEIGGVYYVSFGWNVY